MMKFITEKQQVQEEEYVLPYHYFDLNREHYQYIKNIEILSYLDTVKKLMGNISDKKVLDVGCGDGRFCYELRNSGANLTGIDCSDRAIAFAKIFNPGATFFAGDLSKLRLKEQFDFIVFIETLEHVIPADIPKTLNFLKDFLKDNGKLILTVPSTNMPLVKKHYKHFSPESLKKTLEDHFVVSKILGHGKKGMGRVIFVFLQRLAILLFPFRNKILGVRILFELTQRYYKHNLEICSLDKAIRLIAVCQKK